MQWNQAGLLRLVDRLDAALCAMGVVACARWHDVGSGKVTKLYAGKLRRGLPQFREYFGLTPYEPSIRNIRHDVRAPLPISDGCVDIYQSEDVFEHIAYTDLPSVFDDIFRVLKPGGLFRLSVPDYRCDVLLQRTKLKETGEPSFDPGGGGRFIDGEVVEGGHVWFPVFETVKALFDNSLFASGADVRYLHYTSSDNSYVLSEIDYARGFIKRTPDHDERVRHPQRPISIVVDAVKF